MKRILTFCLAIIVMPLASCQQSPGGGGGGRVECVGAFAGRLETSGSTIEPVLGSLAADRGGSFVWTMGEESETFEISESGELVSDESGQVRATLDEATCSVRGSDTDAEAATLVMNRVPCAGSDYPVAPDSSAVAGNWTITDANTDETLVEMTLSAANLVTSIDYDSTALGDGTATGTFIMDGVAHALEDGSGIYIGEGVVIVDDLGGLCVLLSLDMIRADTVTLDWGFTGRLMAPGLSAEAVWFGSVAEGEGAPIAEPTRATDWSR